MARAGTAVEADERPPDADRIRGSSSPSHQASATALSPSTPARRSSGQTKPASTCPPSRSDAPAAKPSRPPSATQTSACSSPRAGRESGGRAWRSWAGTGRDAGASEKARKRKTWDTRTERTDGGRSRRTAEGGGAQRPGPFLLRRSTADRPADAQARASHPPPTTAVAPLARQDHMPVRPPIPLRTHGTNATQDCRGDSRRRHPPEPAGDRRSDGRSH